MERSGFYPAGGGSFHVEIQPVPELTQIYLPDERTRIISRRVIAVVLGTQR
jgi:RNA 3'-terminal phosphate cyclase